MATAPVSRETTNGTKLRPIAGGPAEPLTRTVLMLDVDSIDIGPNVRVNVEAIDELAASIAEHGVLQPIKVRSGGDRWVVVWGQRRLLAARQAGLERIPAITTGEEQTLEQLSTEQLVENLHRADLNPIDRARAMRAVVNSGVTQADLARQLGLAPSTIANDLSMLEAPAKIQAALEQGELSPAHARALKGLPPKIQAELAQEVIRGGYSAHRTEDEVQRRKRTAEAQRERAAEEATQRKAQEVELVASIALFETKKVPKDARIRVDASYNGSDVAGHVAKLIEAAGYTDVQVVTRYGELQAQPGGKVCDCAVWKASVRDTYSNAERRYTHHVSITKACVNRKHQQAKEALAEQTRRAKGALEEKVKQHVKATAAAWALPDARAIAIDRILAEAVLFSTLGYYVAGWAEKRGGSRSNPWPTVHGLTDGDLASELATAIAGDFRDHSGYHIDWPTLAAELGLVEPVAAPAPKRPTDTRPRPELGDPVVDDGTKYRIRALLPNAAQLALAGPSWRKGEIVALADPARLEYDKAAGLWRGPTVPAVEPASVSPA